MVEVIILMAIGIACIVATLGGLLLAGLVISLTYAVITYGLRIGRDLAHDLQLY